jgi:mediator of RNA polymerase II transcription subunit 12, fungi type
MITCNLAQSAFVVRLAEEYLDGMRESRALVQPFVDACLTKLNDVCRYSALYLIYIDNFAALQDSCP